MFNISMNSTIMFGEIWSSINETESMHSHIIDKRAYFVINAHICKRLKIPHSMIWLCAQNGTVRALQMCDDWNNTKCVNNVGIKSSLRIGSINSISTFYSTSVTRSYKIVSPSLNHEDCIRCIGMFKTFIWGEISMKTDNIKIRITLKIHNNEHWNIRVFRLR